MRELTESLIEKQTNLETLTIEYNSIQLQLKRAEVSERGEREENGVIAIIHFRRLLLKPKLK